MPSFNNLPPAPTPPAFGKRGLSQQQHRQVDSEGGSHYSSRNRNTSQYQQAFGPGRENGTPMPTLFPSSPTKSDPFYAAINTIIDGDIDDKENAAKEEAKHVTFRGRESVEHEDMAHRERRWDNAGGTKWA